MKTLLGGAEVKAQGFGFRYHGASSPALSGIDWDLPAGGSALVLGPSGSGKSTLALALAGVLDPVEDGEASGELQVGGSPWSSRSSPVGLVLQQPDNQTVLHTVGDDVAFGLENLGVDPGEIPRRIREALDTVGLALALDHPTRELSGGQRQRLALAGAIAMRPSLLVLDEPLQALDDEGRAQVLAAVTSLRERENLTLIVVDHEPGVWREFVDQVVLVDRGSASVYPVASAPIDWNRRLTPAKPRRPSFRNTLCACAKLEVGFDSRLPGRHSLEVRSGDILAITGPNGAGKSTLAMTLAGLLPPQAGEVTAPKDPHRLTSRDLASKVSFVPQNPALHHLGSTVREDLQISLALAEEPLRTPERFERWLELFQLGGLLERHSASLSGGEARRLALASATIAGQALLILDEPSQSLDAEAKRSLVELLRLLAHEGSAIVLVTHDRDLISALGAKEYRLVSAQEAKSDRQRQRVPGWLQRANPLSLMGAATAVAVGLITQVEALYSAIALGLIIAILIASGAVTIRSVVRLIPVGMAAVFAAITIAFYGETSGDVIWAWGIIEVSEGSLDLALSTLLRIAAIAMPAVVLFSHVDPTRLADALSQILRLPDRFVVGALAAVRLVNVLGDDYRQLVATRRSRGVGERRKWSRIPADVFSILVIALRRARVLSLAMDARNFGVAQRTHYRRSVWRAGDTVIVALGVAVIVAARWGTSMFSGVS
jgi:energy-coupling factor transporter ATP-binding protein EcfA2/energy-coupling factor transporter transmembrane protein EcfT